MLMILKFSTNNIVAAEGSIKGKSAEERLGHVNRFLNSLLNQKRRPVVMTLILMRKRVRKLFKSREVLLIIEGN